MAGTIFLILICKPILNDDLLFKKTGFRLRIWVCGGICLFTYKAEYVIIFTTDQLVYFVRSIG